MLLPEITNIRTSTPYDYDELASIFDGWFALYPTVFKDVLAKIKQVYLNYDEKADCQSEAISGYSYAYLLSDAEKLCNCAFIWNDETLKYHLHNPVNRLFKLTKSDGNSELYANTELLYELLYLYNKTFREVWPDASARREANEGLCKVIDLALGYLNNAEGTSHYVINREFYAKIFNTEFESCMTIMLGDGKLVDCLAKRDSLLVSDIVRDDTEAVVRLTKEVMTWNR